jgi:lysophospholipase L1-like esterase
MRAVVARWARPSVALDAAAIGEAALRESGRTEVSEVLVPSLKGMVQPSVHDDLVYELKPNRRWAFLGTQVSTNSLGFRDREFAREKAPRALRVVGIGDSIMWGWGIEERDTYLRRLEGSLRAALDRPVEVLNLAVPTYNALQEAAVLKRHGMPLAPDLVIVGYTMNDGTPPAFGGFTSPRRLRERAELLRRGAELLPDPGDAASRTDEGALRVAEAFSRIRALSRPAGVPVALFIYPCDFRADGPVERPDLPRRLALEEGFHYVDMYPAFEALCRARGIPDLRALAKVLAATPHDHHPGVPAHDLVLELLQERVARLLAERGAAVGAP